jgi:hypothetical protein
MSDTPPETPAARPTPKRRGPAKAKAAMNGEQARAAEPSPAKPAATNRASKSAPKAAPKKAELPAESALAVPVPAVPAASTSKIVAKRGSKPKMPTRRRAKPTSRAPLKPRAVQAVKQALPAKPTIKQAAVVAASTGGILAALGAAFFLWRASKADQPDYKLVERDGDFEVREYPGLVTAATEARGPRDAALERGFKVLADYIFAKSRGGDKIAMTAPVLSDGSAKSGWRTRFIMPAGKARADLPSPPSGITLANEPPRRVAAVRFSGRADDADLAAKEGALRSWLQLRAFPSEGLAEHAFYNSPVMPGPLRRNEILITLSTR